VTPTADGFHRRPLPTDAIAFASDEGRAIFREALDAGGMDSFFALSEQMVTQADPAFCGLSSLAVALNALEMDPGRLWKGPWRWYGEELLDCCVPLDVVRTKGITFGQLACLARCNGAEVTSRRTDESTLEDFRRDVVRATVRARSTTAIGAPARGPFLIASYGRAALGETGGGHFSPIGGWHAARDLVLVLDVARFKYPPHWVSLSRLYDAMGTIDVETGRRRGWMLVTRGSSLSSLHFVVSCKREPWPAILTAFDDVAARLATMSSVTIESVIGGVLDAAAPIRDCLTTYEHDDDGLPDAHRVAVRAIVEDLRRTRAFALVEPAAASHGFDPELAAMLLLSLNDDLFAGLADAPRTEITRARDLETLSPALRGEVLRVREQLGLVREMGRESAATLGSSAGAPQ